MQVRERERAYSSITNPYKLKDTWHHWKPINGLTKSKEKKITNTMSKLYIRRIANTLEIVFMLLQIVSHHSTTNLNSKGFELFIVI